MFSPDQWAASTGVAFYNGQATQSLRFDDGSSAHLTRTPSSASNRKTHTLSMWVKRCELGGGSVNNSLFRANGAGDTGRTDIFFDANDQLIVAGSSTYFRITNQVFRDVSSWYHLVFALDTTQSTASDRFKIYVNGSQITSFGTSNDYSLDTDYGINGNVEHQIGTGYDYFDGYMAEVNFVDGTQLDPTSFGEFKNGVWIPKAYTGSYGTNGFRLQFNQTGTGTASSSTIGADTSGNANHFSSSGIVASDCDMPDSPENNFATALGALAEPQDYQNYYKGTYSEGNLKVTGSSSGWSNGSSNFGMTSGKWYAECRINAKAGTGYIRFGMRARPARTYDEYFWNDDGSGQVDASTTPYSSRVGTYTAGDILMVALDLDNSAIYFGKNGTWENSATSSEIANGTTTNAFASGSVIPTDDGYSYFFYCQPFGTGSNITWNFGQDSSFAGLETAQGNSDSGDGITDFYYTPPTGFLGNTTVNLPEPTISPNAGTNKQSDDYFNTVTYTGNGGTLSVTGFGFQPDWLWIKSRSIVGNHRLTDSTRGVSFNLITNAPDAEKGDSDAEDIDSFDSDGFTVTQATYDDFNDSGDTYVAWGWKVNGGTTASNTDGSITSTVQANTDAGFSVVTYTGTDSATETIGHGLGAVPAMLIIKSRDSALNWAVYHKGSDATAPEDYLLRLNTTDARADVSSAWNDTAPTSSVFTVGTSSLVNNTDNFIAYCFAEIEGFSKFGSYTGNGNADGTFVYTGFRPAMVIIKQTNSANNWRIIDDKRDGYNGSTKVLYPSVSNAEGAEVGADLVSNGFKLRADTAGTNASGGTFIYMSFAKNPFKYSLGR